MHVAWLRSSSFTAVSVSSCVSLSLPSCASSSILHSDPESSSSSEPDRSVSLQTLRCRTRGSPCACRRYRPCSKRKHHTSHLTGQVSRVAPLIWRRSTRGTEMHCGTLRVRSPDSARAAHHLTGSPHILAVSKTTAATAASAPLPRRCFRIGAVCKVQHAHLGEAPGILHSQPHA